MKNLNQILIFPSVLKLIIADHRFDKDDEWFDAVIYKSQEPMPLMFLAGLATFSIVLLVQYLYTSSNVFKTSHWVISTEVYNILYV